MEDILLIDPELIEVNPFQPRKSFTFEELEDLAKSIQSVGLIHPPTVRELTQGKFELVSGERRLRASKLAGLTQIPVFVKKASEKLSAEAALIENIQRVDLNPLEIAYALKKLVEEYSLSQEMLADRIGKKRSTLANYLRLLTLPPAIQTSLKNDLITMGHAKAILSLTEIDKQLILHEWILKNSLSVRATEEAAKKLEKPELHKVKEVNPFIYALEKKIEERFGVKAEIVERVSGKGSLTLDFYSLDDLDRILELMGVSG